MTDDPALAIPGSDGSSDGIVTVRIGGRDRILGRLPAGYESDYAAAAERT